MLSLDGGERTKKNCRTDPGWPLRSRYKSFNLHHLSLSVWISALWQKAQEDSTFERQTQKGQLQFAKMHVDKLWLFCHNSSMFTEDKNDAFKDKNTHRETRRRLIVVLLPLAPGTLNLCRAKRNRKTVKAFCREMYCPVLDALCLRCWSWVLQQDNGPHPRMAEKEKWDDSDVACMSRNRNPYECLRKEPRLQAEQRDPSNLRTGAACWSGVG